MPRRTMPATDNSYHLATLRRALKPFRLYFYTRIRSTNEHAAKLRRSGKLYAPAILVAARQLAGRGRGSNVWWSGPGSITVTFVIPIDAGILPHQVPIIAGLGVLRGVHKLCNNTDSRLKWPNDLLHDDLKLAGLLCERVEGADLIGLGLNVNLDLDEVPSSLRHRVTTVAAVAGRQISVQKALTTIAAELAGLLLSKDFGSFAQVLKEYNRSHALKDRRVRISEPGGKVVQGICEGLDQEGRLLVRTPAGLQRLVAGNVELL
ncbi:MAG: biotin--[acetyl-CoA-carboxylase] ligase [Burkholderiales bacterium]|nr:biotin--[acetyl-CoA-carboxylase] ligase [Phycisphaerae bacterium]